MDDQRDRKPSDWQRVKLFTQELGRMTLAVEVKQDVSVPFPKYTLVPGKLNGERVSQYIPIQAFKSEEGVRDFVEVTPVIKSLLEEAEQWAWEKIRENDADFAARKANRAMRSQDGSNKRTAPAQAGPMRKGKTQRDHDRKRGGKRDD
jgi:hypothetical protein